MNCSTIKSNRVSSIQDIKDHNVEFLYHITSSIHLQSIQKFGILSHNKAIEKRKVKEDISLFGTQQLRRNKAIDHIFLHDYACLYFNPRNPMLYKVQKERDDIIIVVVDKIILLNKQVVFSDGNAAADVTSFYSGTEHLRSLNWSIIYADYWTDIDFSTEKEKSRVRCAEVLVYPTVRPEHIMAAICNSDELYKLCSLITNKKLPIHLDKGFFF